MSPQRGASGGQRGGWVPQKGSIKVGCMSTGQAKTDDHNGMTLNVGVWRTLESQFLTKLSPDEGT